MIRLRARIPSLLMALVLAGAPIWAAEYEVGPGRPYQTLQAVANLLRPGDTVTVEGGVTYPGGVSLDANGEPGKGVISIIGRRVNGARPVLSGIAQPGGAVLRVLGSHYVIEGLDVTAGGNAQTARGFYNVADDITLRDSVVHDCPHMGIAGADASGSLTLERVEVFHCGNGLYAHQIYVGSSLAKYPDALFRMQGCYLHDGLGGNNVKSRVTRNEIRYNWIEGGAYHLLDLIGPDPKAQAMPPDAHCDADVIGNVLVVTPAAAGVVARLGTDGTASSRGRYRFAYNTIVVRSRRAAGFGLFWLNGEIDSVAMWDNVFWSETIPLTLVRQERGTAPVFAGAGNWLPLRTSSVPPAWKAITGSDPAFADAGTADYRPAPGSPLIGAGCVPPEPDLVAKWIPAVHGAAALASRPEGRDIGALPAQAGTQ